MNQPTSAIPYIFTHSTKVFFKCLCVQVIILDSEVNKEEKVTSSQNLRFWYKRIAFKQRDMQKIELIVMSAMAKSK